LQIAVVCPDVGNQLQVSFSFTKSGVGIQANVTWPAHPGHSTRKGSPSGKCAKPYTVAASNNGDHPTRSLCYCLFAAHASYGCYSSCTSRSWWNTTPTERLQQSNFRNFF